MLFVISTILLTACNGHSGENEEASSATSVPANISIILLNSQGENKQSFNQDETVTVQVTITDESGKPVSNVRVGFTADLGTLSVDSKLTNDSGVSSIEITNSEGTLGAGTLSASTSSISASIDYEFSSSITSEPTNIAIILLNSQGESALSFDKDETVTVQVTITDQFNEPVNNMRVDFSTDLGIISSDSKLTNDSGVSSIEITNTEGTLGAGTLSASTVSLSASIDYEFIPTTIPEATNIAIVLLNSQSESKQSFDKDETVTVQVTITDQFNEPLNNVRVDLSTDLGTLSLDSKLTNDLGVASIEIMNSDATLGAGTLSAATVRLSASVDYEFISDTSIELLSTLLLEMRVNGTVSNQFRNDEQAQILITLNDGNGDAIENEIVNFTVDAGVLSAASALTNENGQTSVTLSGNGVEGAGVAIVSLSNDSAVSNRINFQISPAGSTILEDTRLGYFDDNNEFVEGEIKSSITNTIISAGGTLGLLVDIVDNENNRINTTTAVTFTSNCVVNGNATIDSTVFSIKGSASATFEDIDCAGTSGTEDIIIASITANGVTNTASIDIEITGEELGSIEFVSALPSSIVIKGSGGVETSTVTFLLKSALGNVLSQQLVEFSLDSAVGGISLSRESGFTNSQGLITTQVSSGTVPSVVRVTAKASMDVDGETTTVQTQSSELSVNTGLPEQSSITVAASVLNPEASTIGEESVISVWLADSFNNPVPDGTTVNFTTEGGTIESSCNTVLGNCSVTWTSTEPFLTDHRSTILATTSGHETFFDVNGNNIFDDEDGEPISNSDVNSGFGRQTPLSSGFVDMSEAWRDDNEDDIKDAEETKFFDNNNDGIFNDADGFFNGPQCTGLKCDESAKKATLRKALVLIMSSASSPNYVLSDTDQTTTYADSDGSSTELPDISDGDSLTLSFRFADSAMQSLPLGTTISVSLDGGDLQGTTSVEIGNTAQNGYHSMDFTLNNASGGDPEQATLTISIKTPNTSSTTYVSKTVSLL